MSLMNSFGTGAGARRPARGRRTVRNATVLVTGAAGGMGLLYARRAVAEGARAVVMWDVNAEALDDVAAQLRGSAQGSKTKVVAAAVDLSDRDAIRAAAERVRDRVGTPDVIVNNAGIVAGSFFWQHDEERDILKTIQVNTLAPMYVVRAFLPDMIASARPARILNIASAAGLFAVPRMSVYAASKAAVMGWSESLRLELKREGHRRVTVTTIAPSYVTTGMFEGATAPLLTHLLTPEYVVDRAWRAMLAGRAVLLLPRAVVAAKAAHGILPVAAWDAVADRLFHIYSSMSGFVGRR
ncbi:hypothetical protein BH09ACT6_BH09ACT6_08600 [soil metagenome]